MTVDSLNNTDATGNDIIDLNISGLIRPVLPIWQNCLSCFGMWVQAVARSRSHGCGRGCIAIALHLTRW
ncbi:hypothetical protein [Microcoleus sp. herbarium12]|uniref:hypothetical protein n=1 Tax=Microcoleus sp. herbarium12 TaxID=3055437 RepID=UPI002FCF4FA2